MLITTKMPKNDNGNITTKHSSEEYYRLWSLPNVAFTISKRESKTSLTGQEIGKCVPFFNNNNKKIINRD